ncbi:telomere-associated protein RIF1 isoform X1 [Kryptolebias marmoratus]|uniref:telomere-associated protein RIF1 isoform X1 n=1 Tax=Kryptolebias marmoratus TaxID=37003 RepID=UPI0007F8EB1D|nr:telomere-associated protein RIF1 isoform X1 [Kryptolebias marmoratus]
MMATAGPSNMAAFLPLLETLEDGTAGQSEQIDAYLTIANRLSGEEGRQFLPAVEKDFSRFGKAILVHLTSPSAELSQAALQALGFCVYHSHVVAGVPEVFAAQILSTLCSLVMKATDKNTCTRALWVISKQNFPACIVAKNVPAVLSALESVWNREDIQSAVMEHEALNVVIRMLEQVPTEMGDGAVTWAKLVVPLVVHSASKVRLRAAAALEMGIPLLLAKQTEVSAVIEPMMSSKLIPELQKLFMSKNETYVLKLWPLFVKLLGKLLHRGGPFINSLLHLEELGFRSSSPTIKKIAFIAWKSLIDNFALNPDILCSAKRIKLLMQPLISIHVRAEALLLTKVEVWWYLAVQLGPNLFSNFDQVSVPLLQSTIGSDSSSSVPNTPSRVSQNGAVAPSTPKSAGNSSLNSSAVTSRMSLNSSMHVSPSFSSIQLLGLEMLLHYFQGPEVVASAAKHKLILNLEPLKHLLLSGAVSFLKHAAVLISSIKDGFISVGKEAPESLLVIIWTSLVRFVNLSIESGSKKDRQGCEVLTLMLQALQSIVVSEGLPADRVLVLFEATVKGLPQRVLGSASYQVGKMDVLNGTPSLFLIQLLFNSSMLPAYVEAEKFFHCLQTLVTCSLSGPTSPLAFAESVLGTISHSAGSLQNKEQLWRMWSSIVSPLTDTVTQSNEVNQGDALEHNFSAIHSALMFPITHLLCGDILPQAAQKSMLSSWSKLYKVFARCSALVVTAGENICCEELCAKVAAAVDREALAVPSTLNFVASILHVMVECVDFSPYTPHFQQQKKSPHTPMNWTRKQNKALGNLSTFHSLLVQCLQVHLESPEALSEATGSALVSVLSALFNNLALVDAVKEALNFLIQPLALFYKQAETPRFTSHLLEKLEKLLSEVLGCLQKCSALAHDDELLALLSPLLCVLFPHKNKHLRSLVMQFWNATFTNAVSLSYPEEMRPVLSQVKQKTPIILPGFEAVSVPDELSGTYSNESSQMETRLSGMPVSSSVKEPLLNDVAEMDTKSFIKMSKPVSEALYQEVSHGTSKLEIKEESANFPIAQASSRHEGEILSNSYPLIMETTRRSSYDAAFKLKAIDLAAQEGNRAAARKLGVNESMVRCWRRQREELIECQKTRKAFRGQKSRWSELEDVLEDWVYTQRAGGRGVSTVQIRLKAKSIACQMNIDNFNGGPSWCFRFMRRKNLSIRARTTLCQQLPPDYQEKVANFQQFVETKIAENAIGPDDIINVDEVPLTFDMPLTKTVNKTGASSILMKTNGHKRTHFTCILGCTASGKKLPPMVIFKRKAMPKDQLPKDIVVKVNQKGWMLENLMKDWLRECYGKRPGGFFPGKKALLVLDSMRAHLTDSVKAVIKRTNSVPAVIPAGTTKYLQPFDISVNRIFKAALRGEWDAWMTSGDKSFTKTGRMRRASFSEVCQWILTAWSRVNESTIINGFRKAGLLREAGTTASEPALPRDDSDTESNTDIETEKTKLDFGSPKPPRKKVLEEEASIDFVFIPPETKERVLTEHQKEVKRTKRVDIPAMYNNLDASLDTTVFTQYTQSQEDSLTEKVPAEQDDIKEASEEDLQKDEQMEEDAEVLSEETQDHTGLKHVERTIENLPQEEIVPDSANVSTEDNTTAEKADNADKDGTNPDTSISSDLVFGTPQKPNSRRQSFITLEKYGEGKPATPSSVSSFTGPLVKTSNSPDHSNNNTLSTEASLMCTSPNSEDSAQVEKISSETFMSESPRRPRDSKIKSEPVRLIERLPGDSPEDKDIIPDTQTGCNESTTVAEEIKPSSQEEDSEPMADGSQSSLSQMSPDEQRPPRGHRVRAQLPGEVSEEHGARNVHLKRKHSGEGLKRESLQTTQSRPNTRSKQAAEENRGKDRLRSWSQGNSRELSQTNSQGKHRKKIKFFSSSGDFLDSPETLSSPEGQSQKRRGRYRKTPKETETTGEKSKEDSSQLVVGVLNLKNEQDSDSQTDSQEVIFSPQTDSMHQDPIVKTKKDEKPKEESNAVTSSPQWEVQSQEKDFQEVTSLANDYQDKTTKKLESEEMKTDKCKTTEALEEDLSQDDSQEMPSSSDGHTRCRSTQSQSLSEEAESEDKGDRIASKRRRRSSLALLATVTPPEAGSGSRTRRSKVSESSPSSTPNSSQSLESSRSESSQGRGRYSRRKASPASGASLESTESEPSEILENSPTPKRRGRKPRASLQSPLVPKSVEEKSGPEKSDASQKTGIQKLGANVNVESPETQGVQILQQVRDDIEEQGKEEEEELPMVTETQSVFTVGLRTDDTKQSTKSPGNTEQSKSDTDGDSGSSQDRDVFEPVGLGSKQTEDPCLSSDGPLLPLNEKLQAAEPSEKKVEVLAPDGQRKESESGNQDLSGAQEEARVGDLQSQKCADVKGNDEQSTSNLPSEGTAEEDICAQENKSSGSSAMENEEQTNAVNMESSDAAPADCNPSEPSEATIQDTPVKQKELEAVTGPDVGQSPSNGQTKGTWSPSASPSTSILKKGQKRLMEVENTSPLVKSRRVSFANPIQHQEVADDIDRRTAVRTSSPRRSKGSSVPQPKDDTTPVKLTSLRNLHSPSYKRSKKCLISEMIQEPRAAPVDCIYPALLGCPAPVEAVLTQISSTMWSRGFGLLVRSRKIKTVGDLSALAPADIKTLPIRSPKISNVKKALKIYEQQRKGRGGGDELKTFDETEMTTSEMEDGGGPPNQDEEERTTGETLATELMDEPSSAHVDSRATQTDGADGERSAEAALPSEVEALSRRMTLLELGHCPPQQLVQMHHQLGDMMGRLMSELQTRLCQRGAHHTD